jgi:transcriptional regulator with XRE-family HTH domain
MKDRITQVIKDLGITKTEFAKRLNVSQAFVSQITSGAASPSERTLTDICEKFGVDPVWLRTGVGDSPFLPVSREDRITDILSKAIAGPSTARDRLIRALARLPDDAFPLIEKYILEAAESLQAEKKE